MAIAMKQVLLFLLASVTVLLAACSATRSGGAGITDTEIPTFNESYNRMDLNVDPNGVTYTIDISTPEGRIKLENQTLASAKKLALEEAAIKNNCARIISPKFSHLMKGKHVLRITVFGFPARYKNSQKSTTHDAQMQRDNNVIIVK